MRYFDTSVVFSLYLNDVHTPCADAELRKNPADVVVSHWIDVELMSAHEPNFPAEVHGYGAVCAHGVVRWPTP